jgi:hypothetical protein
MNTYFYDDYEITELSYFEYKNLVKSFLSAQGEKIVNIFERLVASKAVAERELHVADKIKIILFIRCLVLGEEVSVSFDNKQYNINLNLMIDSISYTKDNFTYNSMVFKTPKNIFYKNKFNCLIDNFYSFELDGETKIVDNYTYKQKEIILQNLLQMKVSGIVEEYGAYLETFYIEYINNIKINLFDSNLLKLIKDFYSVNLNEMYDIEYNVLNYLKFDSNVFDKYGLPELKIFINKYIKEQEEKSKKSGNKDFNL